MNIFFSVFFLIGKKFYKSEVITKSNVFGKVLDCIQYAFFRKMKGYECRANWIEGSIGRYSESFVRDVAVFIKV